MTLRTYFFLGGEARSAGLVPVLRELPQTSGPATAAMNALLAGPNAKERSASPRISTTIPEGTHLLGLSIQDGIATVDLSTEFDSGGGSASCIGRLGEVVYTLTQFSSVDSVAFRVEGRPVSVFGCEGVVLDGPVGRETDRFGQTMFEDLLPAIFVDRPAWGAALDNPAHVTGTANTYEAWLLVALFDASGRQLHEQAAHATCGTGCRGTFDVTVAYQVPKAQWGTLRVFDGDESGETEGISRDYRVWLLPGPHPGGHTCGC
jgi:germination protein M